MQFKKSIDLRAKFARMVHSRMPVILILSGLTIFGCYFQFEGERSYQPLDEVTIPTGFTFATNRSVEFKITVKAYDESDTLVPYVGQVHVIAPAPTGDEILGTGLTDAAGYTDFTVNIPSTVLSVTIRPEQTSIDGLCLLMDFEQALDAGTRLVERVLEPPVGTPPETSASRTATGSRALTKVPFVSSGTGFLMLSTWNASTGVPTGLGTRVPFKQLFLTNAGLTFPESKKVPDIYVNTGTLSNLILNAPAEVSVTMASENSAAKNAVGYFVRKKTLIPATMLDTPPSADIVIIFPNASLSGSGGGLYQGDTIKLRNPDPDSPNYQTTMFDADSVICWVLIPASFVSGKVTEPKGRYYSIPALNPETEGNELQKAHVAQLLYNKSPYAGSLWKLLLGFEDALRSTADDGFFNDDLNDVMLGVSVSPTSAVSTAGLPLAKDSTQVGDADKDGVTDAFDEYPTDATRSSKVSWPSRTGYATVMYEDRWPALGDYDFNDLVVDCRLTTVSNAAGKAVDLVGEFKIRAAGGDLKSGLAFTIPVPSASINSVSYSTKQINTSLYKPGANGVEIAGSKNEKSVVPVFSSAHGLFGLGVTERELINTTSLVAVRNPFYLTVTTSFSQTSPVLASVVAGASPDIFLAGLLDLHDFYGMRKEIHTIGNQPTALADSYPFGEIDDRSPTPPETGTYYIDSRGAPWALLLPVSTKYSIERTQLAATYAHFSQWVYSGGADYPDWYNSDKTGYADSSKLFLLEK